MAMKRYKAEQIVTPLRQVSLLKQYEPRLLWCNGDN